MFDDKYIYLKLVHRVVIGVWLLLYNIFSPSKPTFSSSDARIMSSAFLQKFSLRQSPQAVTHWRLFLWQEHTLFPREFLEESLHLHHINFSRVSGATAMPVVTRVNVVPSSFLLHYSGSNLSLHV